MRGCCSSCVCETSNNVSSCFNEQLIVLCEQIMKIRRVDYDESKKKIQSKSTMHLSEWWMLVEQRGRDHDTHQRIICDSILNDFVPYRIFFCFEYDDPGDSIMLRMLFPYYFLHIFCFNLESRIEF